MNNRERDKISGLTFETKLVEENGNKIEIPTAVFIQSGNISKCIDYMKEHALKSVIINSAHKYKLQHLNFLNQNSFVESVEIETDIDDCSALNGLHNLKNLSLHYSTTQVDFSNFSELETLNFTWGTSLINWEKCTTLKHLTIWNYPKNNLSEFQQLSNLETLEIDYTKLVNLLGIEHLTNLQEFILEKAPLLESVEPLAALQKMKKISFTGCKKLTDYSPIGFLSDLQYLDLIHCGDTPNINFINNLNQLEYGYFDINIIDGQVKALLERPIIFKNHKHFSHKNNLKIKCITNVGNYLERDGVVIKRFF